MVSASGNSDVSWVISRLVFSEVSTIQTSGISAKAIAARAATAHATPAEPVPRHDARLRISPTAKPAATRTTSATMNSIAAA